MTKALFALVSVLALASCGQAVPDPRGVDHKETLLSVSATGEAETRPDQAQFQAGINAWEKTAKGASDASARQIAGIVAALKELGIAEKDIQTRTTSVQRIDWGDRRGQYQASNIVNVTVRDVDKVGEAVAATTEAGANIVSGPDLRMANPEKAATSAYTNAYRAARARAEAYAAAADMKIMRVLAIRDSGGVQGNRYLPSAVPAAPPPVLIEQSAANAAAPIMAGQTTSTVAIQVDFALVPK
jgi:uncharacterized protein YggE